MRSSERARPATIPSELSPNGDQLPCDLEAGRPQYVRTPGRAGYAQEVAEFATTARGLSTLGNWPCAQCMSEVNMEADGVYWEPVWAVLEDDSA